MNTFIFISIAGQKFKMREIFSKIEIIACHNCFLCFLAKKIPSCFCLVVFG